MSHSLISTGAATNSKEINRMSSSSSSADAAGSSNTTSQQQQQQVQDGSKKRNRAVLSCLMCHQRRVKCDRKQPCEACINYGCASECSFASRPEKKSRKGSRDENAIEGARRSSGQASSSVSVSPSQEYANVAQSIPQISPGQQSLFSAPIPTKKNSMTEAQNILPNPSFFSFVERFQQHTQSQDKQASAANFNFYPMDAFSAIQAARLDLPVMERILVLIQYYNDHLDWFHEIYDHDEVANWISPFLDKYSQRSVLTANMLDQGDATKLCLIMTVCISSIQIMSEGLVSMFFLDSQPVGLSLSTVSRSAIKDSFEMHVRNLLDAATQYDGHSSDLVRCSLIYVHLLKNEGRHHESSNRPFITSISHIVEQEKLHLDPPPTLSDAERESRRKLFWTYYALDRMTSAHLNFEIRIPDDRITTRSIQKETWSPRLGRRNHLVHFHRTELCKIAGKLSKVLDNSNKSTNSASDSIQEVEDQLQAWQESLPLELQKDFTDLSPELGPIRILDLQRRMLQIGFCATRAGLHRLCFFPTDTISLDRVQKSRRICVESAIDMIKVQDGLRLHMPGDQNLRCFFISYFLVESAITLILTSLIDLGSIPAGVTISEKIQDYMRYAQRARDLINSLPPDFTPAVQGVRLLSRVLAKATKILDLHAQHKLTPTESRAAIRDVLCDEDGKQMPIPFYTPADNSVSATAAPNTTGNLTSRSGIGSILPRRNIRVSFPSTSDTGTNNGRTPVDGITHSSSYSDLSSSLATPPDFTPNFANTFASNAAPTPSNNYMNYTTTSSGTVPAFSSSPQYRLAEPTYEDLGLEFFNSLANALPFPFPNEGSSEQEQQQQQQQPSSSSAAFTPSSYLQQQETPQDSNVQQSQNVAGMSGTGNNFGLDDQMDIWLASLQTIP